MTINLTSGRSLTIPDGGRGIDQDGNGMIGNTAILKAQINPGTTAILLAGNLRDLTLHYRYDLAFAEDPAIPKNLHPTLLQVAHRNSTLR